MRTEWMLGPAADRAQVDRVREALACSPVLAELLIQRGCESAASAEQFLRPSLATLRDPDELPDIARAVSLIEEAIARRERICVFGDYDVDGLTSTALLHDVLKHLGAEVDTYIPHRLVEGYGLNEEAVRTVAARGTRLLVTVDGGCNDLVELALARELGMQVVVTDHHPVMGALPDCPVVHPGRPDHPTASASLAGVGVVYKLIWALGRSRAGARRVSESYRELMVTALGLVALGTVADVVPLVGENRALVRYGLRALADGSHAGLRALLAECGFAERAPSARDVAFRLAPPLNAAGRLGFAEIALELLLTRERESAADLSRRLVAANQERRVIESAMLDSCEALLAAERAVHGEEGPLVLAAPGWHAGVAGIVAARLVERHARPSFVIALDPEGQGRGSIRTPEGVSLVPYYELARPHVVSIGGHARAGGLTVRAPCVEALRDALRRASLPPRSAVRQRVDVALDPARIDLALARELELLAPHGEGNPVPRFLVRGARLARAPRLLGRGEDHLAFAVERSGQAPLRAIFFSGASHASALARHQGPFDLVAELSISDYRGPLEVELRILDLHLDD